VGDLLSGQPAKRGTDTAARTSVRIRVRFWNVLMPSTTPQVGRRRQRQGPMLDSRHADEGRPRQRP
jgi:hypothetical protein